MQGRERIPRSVGWAGVPDEEGIAGLRPGKLILLDSFLPLELGTFEFPFRAVYPGRPSASTTGSGHLGHIF